jgi:hypothetical protein
MPSSPSFFLFAPFICLLLFLAVDKAITTNYGVVVIVAAAKFWTALLLWWWQRVTMEVLLLL